MKNLQITMDVRAYRERPSIKEAGKTGIHTNRSAGPAPKRNAQSLWDYLATQSAVL